MTQWYGYMVDEAQAKAQKHHKKPEHLSWPILLKEIEELPKSNADDLAKAISAMREFTFLRMGKNDYERLNDCGSLSVSEYCELMVRSAEEFRKKFGLHVDEYFDESGG